MFPTSHARSWWFLKIPYRQGRWNRSLAIFERFQDGAFRQTTFASPSAWRACPSTSIALAIGLWKRPFWFSKKVNITLSLNWSMPYEGGCSQFLISSRGFDSSICDWKNKFSLCGKYHLFRIESFRVDFLCVHCFQLLKVCDQYVTFPNSPRVQCVSEEQPR